MRRFILGLAIAVIAAPAPAQAWVSPTDQQMSRQLASMLHRSGQLSDYKVGVKFESGTAYVVGRVADRDQMSKALRMVKSAAGVQNVVNQLTLAPSTTTAAPAIPASATVARRTRTSPFRSPPLAGDKSGARPAPGSPIATNVAQGGGVQLAVGQAAQRPMAGAGLPVGRPIAYTGLAAPAAAMAAPMMMAQQAGGGGPIPSYVGGAGGGARTVRYDQPHLPGYAWPGYAAHPNYGALTYPKQYSPTAWPYIGPFYPYPQVPLGWRKVTLEWDDGWWMLDFKNR